MLSKIQEFNKKLLMFRLRAADVEHAEQFARNQHDVVMQQKYNGFPYSVGHLELVVRILEYFKIDDYRILMAGWLHDILEDTNVTYYELNILFGAEITALVFACTDGEGENRKERKAASYEKILKKNNAILVKLADRIANVTAGGKLDMYKKEHADFKEVVWDSPCDWKYAQTAEDMEDLLNSLLEE